MYLLNFLTSFHSSCWYMFNSNATIMHSCFSRLLAPFTTPGNSQQAGETNSFWFLETVDMRAFRCSSLIGKINYYEKVDCFIFSAEKINQSRQNSFCSLIPCKHYLIGNLQTMLVVWKAFQNSFLKTGNYFRPCS